MNRRVLLIVFTLLACAAASASGEDPSVRISEYKFEEYRRSPRMEEMDRLNGNSFQWQPGLEIITDLYDVEVELFEEKIGRTPWEQNNLRAGAYRVRLTRSGYQTVEFWVTVRSDRRTVAEVVMGKPSGRLSLSAIPPGASVLVDRVPADTALVTLSGGLHSLSVTAFGWEPVQTTVEIPPGGTLEWSYKGSRTPFSISSLRVRPASLPPGDAKGFEIEWSVQSPGSADVRIFSPDGTQAAALSFSIYAPSGTLRWVPAGSGGTPLPDGGYRVVAAGTGFDGVTDSRETALSLDSRFRRAARLSAAALPGLLYAPGTAMLSAGLWQISTGAGIDVHTGEADEPWGIPVYAAARVSPGRRWEMSGRFGITARDPFDTTSIGLSLSGSFRVTPSYGLFSMNTALLFSYEGYAADFGRIPGGNPGTSLPGLQLSVPMELALSRRWFLSASPSVYLTFLGTDPDDWSFSGPARTAGGFSLGGYFEEGGMLAGASAALRTPDLPGGFLDWNLWCGLEGRANLPGDASWLALYAGARVLSGSPVVVSGIEIGILR
jgi:hypothetical protein